MTDHGNTHRAALIAGLPAPKLSIEAKRFAAIKHLGNHYVLKGGTPDWTRPTVLTAWISKRWGYASRVAGL